MRTGAGGDGRLLASRRAVRGHAERVPGSRRGDAAHRGDDAAAEVHAGAVFGGDSAALVADLAVGRGGRHAGERRADLATLWPLQGRLRRLSRREQQRQFLGHRGDLPDGGEQQESPRRLPDHHLQRGGGLHAARYCGRHPLQSAPADRPRLSTRDAIEALVGPGEPGRIIHAADPDGRDEPRLRDRGRLGRPAHQHRQLHPRSGDGRHRRERDGPARRQVRAGDVAAGRRSTRPI